MPRYAWVTEELKCPRCGAVLSDLVWFAWGGLMTADPKRGPVYAIGDHLLWFADADGVAQDDRYWAAKSSGSREGVNFGDPRLLDVDVYEPDGEEAPRLCGSCGLALQGVCVSIRGGVVAGVAAVPEGAVDDGLHAIVYDGATGRVTDRLPVHRPIIEMPGSVEP